jgi:cell wall-associated NlpC family hydrolase
LYRPLILGLSVLAFAASGAVAEAKSHAQVHTVQPGETLGAIAAEEHISVGELARVNQVEGTGSVASGSVLALKDESSEVAPKAQFEISPHVRQQLRALEVSSNMPNAGADEAMWSSGDARPAAMLVEKKSDSIHRFARGIISRTSSIAMSLTRSAMRFIGTPYVFGGTSPSGFDCSGYVQHVFAMLGISLPRTADAQYYAGRPTIGGIHTGDLVFFQTYEPGPSHVGIYIGAGKFIHSSSHGVMVSRIADDYWASRYLGAKRVVASR